MMTTGALLLLLLTTASALPFDGLSEVAFEAKIIRELDHYIETKEFGGFLQNLAEELDIKGIYATKNPREAWKEPRISLFCTTCHAGINRVLAANTTTEIFTISYNLCIDLGIGTQVLCEGVVTMMEPMIIYMYENSGPESGNDICSVLFVAQGCKSNDPKREWSVTLPDVSKPAISEPPFPHDPPSTLKVLHLADTHYDPKYTPRSNAVCAEVYFCCNPESGEVLNPEDEAGYWGDYRNCDIPMWTLEAMYQSISETHPDIDFIVWTGDLTPHIVWDTSREEILSDVNAMNELLRTYFPNTPVFPAVGNHEGVPVNLFSQPYITDPDFTMAWLYVELANLWSFWLPADTTRDILYSAYYSTPVRTGLKLVSINTNWCYNNNWWLIYDSTDIASELDFLAKELQASEDIGERVYIIGHIPPGFQGCQLTWSREFNRIISRYEDTVTGMFFGHTHNDHFQLFFDPDEPTRPFDIGYIAQSQTTYSELNPGYKIYTVEGDFDGSRYRVLEHDNYIMDLDEANLSNVTTFFKQYTASEAYGMTDLSPDSWLDVVNRMNVPDSTLFDTFFTNYVKGGTPALARGCSDNCKDNILCRLLTSDNSDKTQCEAAGLD